MCNMAGYNGTEQAAPILLRMIERQEGMGSGHFTGLATLHEGRIYSAKVCGGLKELLARTDAASLPGTVGIIHSRTPGYPLDSWAHPFLSSDGRVAYTANGARGMFEGKADSTAIHERLLAEGYRFDSESSEPGLLNKGYPVMPGGTCLHFSDLMCGLVAEKHREMDLPSAVRAAYTEAPSELAGLFLSTEEPASFTAVRLNQSLFWGRKGSNHYVATCALAFEGEDLDSVRPLPAACTMRFQASGLEVVPFGAPLGQMVIPTLPLAEAFARMEAIMSDGKMRKIGSLAEQIKDLWQEGFMPEHVMAAYQFLYEKVHKGEYEIVETTAPASLPGAWAVDKFFRKK